MTCNPIVTVTNIDVAKRFYVDILGFSVDFDAGEMMGLLRDQVLILLIAQGSENVRQPAGSSNLSFLADEVDSLFARCVSADADIFAEP